MDTDWYRERERAATDGTTESKTVTVLLLPVEGALREICVESSNRTTTQKIALDRIDLAKFVSISCDHCDSQMQWSNDRSPVPPTGVQNFF